MDVDAGRTQPPIGGAGPGKLALGVGALAVRVGVASGVSDETFSGADGADVAAPGVPAVGLVPDRRAGQDSGINEVAPALLDQSDDGRFPDPPVGGLRGGEQATLELGVVTGEEVPANRCATAALAGLDFGNREGRRCHK